MKIRQAFTLVEVLVAVAILTLVITGATIVESSNIRIGTSSKYNFQASGLAQAGTNLVKAVSDKVHLGISATVIASECTDPTNLAKCPVGVYYLNSNNKLLICSSVDSTNPLMPICNVAGAVSTIDGMQFRRSVIISSSPIVRVIISWLEKGQVRTLESKIYLGSTAPTVTFYASPTTVVSGASSTLTWSSTNATSCTATGNWSWSGATTSGSQSTGALTSSKTYTLTCSGSGGTSLPASASVTVTGVLSCNGTTIYDSANFIGTSKALPLGDYDVNAMVSSTCGAKLPIADTKSPPTSTGLCEDTISSIKVGSGCYVFAFDHSGLIRTTMTPYMIYPFANFVSDIANLATTNIDDKISSLKVVNASDYPVSVYAAINYGGTNAYLPIGWQDMLRMTTIYGIPSTDKISSVKVASGYFITLYADYPRIPNGVSQTFKSDSPTVGVFDIIVAKSLEVGLLPQP